jgi:hypothetical protein
MAGDDAELDVTYELSLIEHSLHQPSRLLLLHSGDVGRIDVAPQCTDCVHDYEPPPEAVT